MERSFWCALLLTLQLLLSCASAATRHLAPSNSGMRLEPSRLRPEDPMARSMERVGEEKGSGPGGLVAGMKIGSSPPNCEHKCSGCTPCEPAQVPATSSGRRSSRLRVQYTNYLPEGWKCKCGPSFYSP